MEQWQNAASQQVKLITDRMNEVLGKGLEWLEMEIGVKVDFLPPWLILLAACGGLLLMVLLWASLCRTLFRKKPISSSVDEQVETKRAPNRAVKPEEVKKKKKKADKKVQPNGRAIAETQEEEEEAAATISEEVVPPHQIQGKKDKIAETKKSKKKAKQAVKETKTVSEGKEPEEGTWETKVSNKEKREQRKKDKSSSDGSASPGGGDTPVSTPPDQPKPPSAATPPAPSNQKKKKGESAKVKAEAVACKVKTNEPLEVSATDAAVKVSAQAVPPKATSWSASRPSAPLWRAGIDEPWTVIDRPLPSDLNLVTLTGLGTAQSGGPVNDLSWLSQPKVDDEWSGLNGGSADPSSDWNAPSEAWGNYEEPNPEPPQTQEQTPSDSAKVNPMGAADDDEDDKEKGDGAADGGAKTKRKKKKKKKAAEEGGSEDQKEEPVKEAVPVASVKKQENVAAVQPVKTAASPKVKAAEARGDRQVKEVVSQKAPVTQVPQKSADGEPTAKQNNLPAPAQQKRAEESKPAKKKKARRET